MIRRFVVLCAVLALAACGRTPEPVAPPAKPYLGGPLVAQEWGVGPIRSSTFFESPRIRELFPKAEVKDGEIRVAEDETRSVIDVFQDGAQMLQIIDGYGNFPGTDDPMIGKVRLVGGAVRGPQGETIGMRWKDAHFDLSQCERGVEREADTMVCARPKAGAVTYIFALPGWKSMEFPTDSQMRANGFLSAMVWTPNHHRRH